MKPFLRAKDAGQDNDIFWVDEMATGAASPAPGRTGDDDITAGQKMLSATSGSLLTSFLGTHSPLSS
jgi:hypothetical protein